MSIIISHSGLSLSDNKGRKSFSACQGFIDINEREVGPKLMTVVFHVGYKERFLKNDGSFKDIWGFLITVSLSYY